MRTIWNTTFFTDNNERQLRAIPGPLEPMTRGREVNSDLTEKTLNLFRKLGIDLLSMID